MPIFWKIVAEKSREGTSFVIKAIRVLVCWAGKAIAGSAETWEGLRSRVRRGGKAGVIGRCRRAWHLPEPWRQSQPKTRPAVEDPSSVGKAENLPQKMESLCLEKQATDVAYLWP